MNTSQKYASSCGVPLGEPTVAVGYFPLKTDKYIIIDNRNRNDMNTYGLYSDVISYIYPFLEKEGVKIISFCKSAKNPIEKTTPYISLTKKQEAFFIENALLVVSSESLTNHIANALGVKSIGLYSIFPSETVKPIWKEGHVAIESKKKGNLPSYGLKEFPKAIDFINPEEISQNILDAIGINVKIPHETLYIGDYYSTKVVEVIPDFVAPPEFMKNKSLNLRMDYHFDENNMCKWLHNRYLNVMTDKPVNIDMLKYFKKNIAQLTISINENFSNEYLKEVQRVGLKLEIFCENKKEIANYRFKFFDFDINETIYKSKKELKDVKITSNTKFLSSKILLSEGQKYSCHEAKKAKKPLTGAPEKVYDTEKFYNELDYYRIIHEQIQTK